MIKGLFDFFSGLFFTGGVQMAVAPLMVGAAALSAASALGNAIFGGISANRQRRKQLKAIDEAQRKNRDWYNRRYNEDATQRADVQRMLSRTNEAIAARNRAAAGKRAVVGGTDASLASTQQANAAAVGDAISQVATNAQERKDGIEAAYRERDQQLENAKNNVQAASEEARRNATAQAASGAINAMASVAANAEDNGKGKSKPDVTGNPPGGASVLAKEGTKKGAAMLTPLTIDEYIRKYPSLDEYWNRK